MIVIAKVFGTHEYTPTHKYTRACTQGRFLKSLLFNNTVEC
jgi:hypothetical protein